MVPVWGARPGAVRVWRVDGPAAEVADAVALAGWQAALRAWAEAAFAALGDSVLPVADQAGEPADSDLVARPDGSAV